MMRSTEEVKDTDEDRNKAAVPVSSAAKDFIGGIVLLAIAAVSFSQMGSKLADWIYPRILTYILVVGGAVLVIRSSVRFVLHRHGGQVDVAGFFRQRVVRDVLLFILGILVYVLLQRIIGFWVSSVLMLTGLPYFLSVKRTPKELVLELIIAILVCAVAYFIFAVFFLVPLPTGILFGV